MSMKYSPFFRKRTRSTVSIDESESEAQSKRLRRTSTEQSIASASFSRPTPGPSSRMSSISDLSFFEDGPRLDLSPRRPRLSASSSFSAFPLSQPLSRASSIMSDDRDGYHALMRSASVGDLRRKRDSLGPGEMAAFREHSAYYNVRAVNHIDYSVSSGGSATGATTAPPLGWTLSNALIFSRGNRVYHKVMTDNEGVAQQLTKLNDNMGNLSLVHCGGQQQPNTVALGTSNGYIQLWDLGVKKAEQRWKVKGPTAMTFSPKGLLTIGDAKGTLRHYDSRTNDAAKMKKDPTKKGIRHQSKITALAWARDNFYVASGDQSGLVLVWDIRASGSVPLEVGEMVQRRRKMQHVGAITALAWCPWYGKYLVSGDSAPDGTGTIRVWDLSNEGDSSQKNPDRPTRLNCDAQITSIHFSPQINEVLTTHGSGQPMEVPSLGDAQPLRARMANSLVVHQFPRFRHVTTQRVAEKNVAGSVLSPNGQRIVLAVPEEAQLKVWDVWGKFREPKQKTLMDKVAIR